MYIFCLSILLAASHISSQQCLTDLLCPEDKACINRKCQNPCPGDCRGPGSQCQVRDHYPQCWTIPEPASHISSQSTCSTDSDCDSNKACINELCVDPCVGNCGANAQCSVLNHFPLCSCVAGFDGDPFTQCDPKPTLPPKESPCQKAVCGPNSVCNDINDVAECACETGYIGSPPDCRPECINSNDCSFKLACVNEKCVNPCIDTCGVDAACTVVTHTPICSCPPGTTGDPFTRCDRIKENLPTPRPNLCNPSPCGSNTLCLEVRGTAKCECLPSYTGNPLLGCSSTRVETAPIPTAPTGIPLQMPESGKCTLPPFPENGHYDSNIDGGQPGQSHPLVIVNVTCNHGYGVVGPSSIYCYNGYWPHSFPKCVQMCQLDTHPSVEYLCLFSSNEEGYRPCTNWEPSGTIVNPVCRRPNYYAATTLTYMRCIGGYWNYIAKCTPECGKVTPEGVDLVIGGRPAKRGELPWHAGIYRKIFNHYMQICGGSLISNRIVISAAHCFWTDLEKQLPASQFAVAVGKLYRPWNDKKDEAQKSDVLEIRIPQRFRGAAANFQDDLAVLIVKNEFMFKTYIRPVCLSFDINIERMQLPGETKGKVAGWGLTAENGNASKTLQVIDLPFVEIATCIAKLPFSFQEYITSDKICAGTTDTRSGLCKGDSGGGLAFPVTDRGTLRYYLHGVVSTAPNEENVLCNSGTYTTFTQILHHELFIKLYWNEI